MGRPARTLERYNRAFYERRWRAGSVVSLPGVRTVPGEALVVEVGCGLRPRLPLAGALFVDLSRTACRKLRQAGSLAVCASVARLPLRTGSVRAIHAYEVVEHLVDDAGAVAELARVLVRDGTLVVSTPLHGERWQVFDRIVGHARRYEPPALLDLMEAQGFTLDGFAPFGMRPRSRVLTALGAWYLTRWPRLALRYEERFLHLRRSPESTVILRRADRDHFLRAAPAMDGAVTSWRRGSRP